MALKDLPDYTREMVIRYEGGFIGLEELAARLGSIVPWDLKGNIILTEDFESELTEWTDDSTAGGSTATRSSGHKHSGDWSAKLYNIGGAGTYATLDRYLHFPGMLKYALFSRCCWDDDCQIIFHALELDTGVKEFTIAWEYNLLTGTLSVWTTGGVYHTVATGLILHLSPFIWYPALITFDLVTGYYDKLYFADREYDISDVALYYTELGTAPGGLVTLSTEASEAGIFTAYVDDIIIAKNVP